MNVKVDQIKMSMRGKLMPYSAMLDYRYKNLCVKTSTEALLPVEVKFGEKELPLEDVAKAGIIDDEHFMIAPTNIGYVTAVCQAFIETHPQLKQELFDPVENPYISQASREKIRNQKQIFREQMNEELILPQVLILTTPEVDDDSKDALNNTVDVLKKQCEVLYKKEYTRFKTELQAALVKSSPDEINSANKELDDEYNKLWQDVEKYTMEECQAIEEANQRYHERKMQRESEANNHMNESDFQKSQTMKFGEYEE